MSTSSEEELHQRLRVELLKAELEEQHGAMNGPSSLPPKVEVDFLERVRDLEAGGPRSYVSIGSLVPRKHLKRADSMARRGKYRQAISAVIKALREACVITDDDPMPLPPPAYYRWLTKDLFAHTIPKPSTESPDPNDPGLRHAIGVMFAQVAARQQREAGQN